MPPSRHARRRFSFSTLLSPRGPRHHHQIVHSMFAPSSQPAHLPVVDQEAQFHWGTEPKEFRFHPHVVSGLLHNLGSCLLGSSLRHQQRRRHGREILDLDMDREAFTSDLGDDRRGPAFFFWRFRKRQQVVLAVRHNNTRASACPALASLRSRAEPTSLASAPALSTRNCMLGDTHKTATEAVRDGAPVTAIPLITND